MPRVTRCFGYYCLIASKPDKLKHLSAPCFEIKLPDEQQSMNGISIGYTQVPTDSANIERIKFYEELGVIVIDSNSVSYLFMSPWETSKSEPNSEELLAEPALIDSNWQPIPSEELYSIYLKTAQTMPKKYWEIFMMNGQEFKTYVVRATLKTVESYNYKGIGVFETDQIKGLLRFGSADSPSTMYAIVFSKQSDITQGIRVKSDFEGKSEDAMFSLLSSYRFLITELPEQDQLCQSISSELEKHDTFEIIYSQE